MTTMTTTTLKRIAVGLAVALVVQGAMLAQATASTQCTDFELALQADPMVLNGLYDEVRWELQDECLPSAPEGYQMAEDRTFVPDSFYSQS